MSSQSTSTSWGMQRDEDSLKVGDIFQSKNNLIYAFSQHAIKNEY